jgi:NAD(P)-dependent dehydrogenase (short-subunit alcohol dehydrogenase family)
MDLSGRVVCITGGAGHIGSAMADAVAELGAAVVVADRDAERCTATTRRVTETWSVETLALALDLEDEDAARRVGPAILERFARLDVLVNCAAFVGTSDLEGWAVPFSQQSTTAWRRALAVNLTAPFIVTQTCAAALAASGHGSVINVLSIYGLVGPDFSLYEATRLGNPAAYGSSKGGLLQLTRYLATALGPTVRVNAITPGGVERDQPVPFASKYVQRTPLGRMAHEEDFKGAVAYLASDLSAYVTGQNLVVDGGWTAW